MFQWDGCFSNSMTNFKKADAHGFASDISDIYCLLQFWIPLFGMRKQGNTHNTTNMLLGFVLVGSWQVTKDKYIHKYYHDKIQPNCMSQLSAHDEHDLRRHRTGWSQIKHSL